MCYSNARRMGPCRSLFLALCLLVGLAHFGTGRENAEEFDIANDGDMIVLPVNIEGQNYEFALDTGCGITVYDTSFRPLLGTPHGDLLVTTPNGRVRGEVFTAPVTRLGSHRLANNRGVVILDLSTIRRVSGHEVYGVLGMDFLRGRIVTLNPDRRKLTIVESAVDAAARKIPIHYDNGGVPFVDAEIPGFGPRAFQIDTGMFGFSSGNIDHSAFHELMDRNLLMAKGSSTLASTFSGSSRLKTGGLKTMSLGGYSHTNLRFREARSSALGMGYWRRFVATFDFRENFLYLERSKHFPSPDRDLVGGLHILRIDGHVVVASVDQGSAAAEGGVQAGDVVLAVDNHDAAKTRLHVLRLAMTDRDGFVNVVIQRSEQVLELRIRLESPEEQRAPEE